MYVPGRTEVESRLPVNDSGSPLNYATRSLHGTQYGESRLIIRASPRRRARAQTSRRIRDTRGTGKLYLQIRSVVTPSVNNCLCVFFFFVANVSLMSLNLESQLDVKYHRERGLGIKLIALNPFYLFE